jgi:serine/threonine protein kinase
LPRAGDQKFVLKPVSKTNSEYFQDLDRGLDGCPYVRPLHDTITHPLMFVFKYANEDLLSLVQKNLPITTTKKILKDTLRGLATLHDRHIIHAGK